MTQKSTHVKPALGLPEFIALMALMTSLVALSIDAMLPALDAIGTAMGAKDIHESHLIVSLFFWWHGCRPVIFWSLLRYPWTT